MSAEKNMQWASDCNIQFAVFYFVVHCVYFWCMPRLQDFTFLNINLTIWTMMLKLYCENSILAS